MNSEQLPYKNERLVREPNQVLNKSIVYLTNVEPIKFAPREVFQIS